MKYLIPWLAAAVLLIAYLWMIAPRKYDKTKYGIFLKRIFANRGLYDNVTVPENSLTAFRAAAKQGHGIKTELRLTADGEVICFADSDLSRLCGVEAKPETLTRKELKNLRLLNTEERIPTLREIIVEVGDKVPLIFELTGADTRLCDEALPILANSPCDYCVESFEPSLVRRAKSIAPNVCRGIMMTHFKKHGEKRGARGVCMQMFLYNHICRPDFVSVEHYYDADFSTLLCHSLGAESFAWTVRTKDEYRLCKDDCDTFVCENIPELLTKPPKNALPPKRSKVEILRRRTIRTVQLFMKALSIAYTVVMIPIKFFVLIFRLAFHGTAAIKEKLADSRVLRILTLPFRWGRRVRR